MKAIFYASSTGNTEEVANKIKEKLNDFEVIDIAQDGIDKIKECNSLIIGSPTWGEGDLQDDWEDYFEEFQEIDFTGKTVALFGLGDQDNYSDEFVDALGILYEAVEKRGAKIVGFTSTDGYEYDESKAVIDDKFVGLVIDEDNQAELTDERVQQWCEVISKEI